MDDKEKVLQDRYRIVKLLGRGGMGAVYLAEDQRLPTNWAIKEMKKEGLSAAEHAEASELFRTEARLLSELRHRNLPRIVDFFEADDRLYLVMDHIEGETLESRYDRNGPLTVKFAMEMALQIADVLDYLHTRPDPIVFRDFKPGNVMLTPQDEVKLIDFGIARVFRKDQNKDTKALGTPGYAAPEQYGRGQSGPRTDLYAFGATIHHVLSGHDPTDEPFVFAPLRDFRSDLPEPFVQLIESCVCLQPEGRPESAFAIKRQLEQLLGQTGSSALAAGRPTTTQLDSSSVPVMAPATAPVAPTTLPLNAHHSIVLGDSEVVFRPSSVTIKDITSGGKATARVRVKTKSEVKLVCDSPSVTINPESIPVGSSTVVVTIDSSTLEPGSTFKAEVEVEGDERWELPLEAKIGIPRASGAVIFSMVSLCLLTLLPFLNFLTTLVAGIIVFSTPKNQRKSLSIPWRLSILFTLGWSAFFTLIAFGLTQVDWTSLEAQMRSWLP